MQQDSTRFTARFRWHGIVTVILIMAGFSAFSCSGKQPDETVTVVETKKPFEGQSVRVSCANAELTSALTPVAKAWSAKTGAGVTFTREEPGDISILPANVFGESCARGEFQTLAKPVRNPLHPFQINGQTDAFLEGLAGWQGQPHGVILATDAALLLYRKDRFDDIPTRASFKTRYSRDLLPPVSWDEFADIATFFTALDRKPALPGLPRDTARLLDLFHRIAASTDRPAITPTNMLGRKLEDIASDAFSFHFDFMTGRPRLTSPGFAMAVEILAQQAAVRGTDDGDPIAALESGSAVMAIATMADIARISKGADNAIPAKFGVSKVPGSKRYYDSITKQIETMRGNEPNIVPYLGGGWIGGVKAQANSIDAAFDLLGHLGSPDGAGAVISRPAVGSGPWRASLLDANKKNLWFAYGFGPEQTQALMTALRPYVASDLRNPAIAPRGPGIESLMTALGGKVRDAATGLTPPATAMKQAQDAWLTMEAAAGTPEQVRAWRRGDMRGK